MAQRTRLELATSRVTGGCSNQLSYNCNNERIAENELFFNLSCVGGEGRTLNLSFMSAVL